MEWKQFPATSPIPEESIEIFKLFCGRVQQLSDNWSDLLGDQKTISVNFDRSSGALKSGGQQFNIHRLKGLYSDFRVFCGKGDPTRLEKIACLIRSHFEYCHVHAAIESEIARWIKEPPTHQWHGLSVSEIRAAIFNTQIFHSNPKKLCELERILSVIDEASIHKIIWLDIFDKKVVLKNFSLFLQPLSKGVAEIRIPQAIAKP